MRTIGNLLKLIGHLAIAAFFGYYNFTYHEQSPWNGYIALGTSICFFAIGFSAALSWQKAVNKQFVSLSVPPSSAGTATGADAAAK